MRICICIKVTLLKPMHFDNKVNTTFMSLLKASNKRVEHKNILEINFHLRLLPNENIKIYSLSLS